MKSSIPSLLIKATTCLRGRSETFDVFEERSSKTKRRTSDPLFVSGRKEVSLSCSEGSSGGRLAGDGTQFWQMNDNSSLKKNHPRHRSAQTKAPILYKWREQECKKKDNNDRSREAGRKKII